MPIKAAFYVDGFNLYHAIEDLGQHHLKWLDLRKLAQTMIPARSEELVRVVYCTAVKTHDKDKMLRHRAYLKALGAVGVDCLEGHFAFEDRHCSECGHAWKSPSEKQSDVNLAIGLIDDAHRSVFDHAYLVTADGDQAATVRLFIKRFSDKRITTVSPPLRSHNRMILEHAHDKIALNYHHIERILFPRAVLNTDGSVAAIRLSLYDPPPGWVTPEQRPR